MRLQISQHASSSLPVKKKKNVFESQTPFTTGIFHIAPTLIFFWKCRFWHTQWTGPETNEEKTNLNISRGGWICACQSSKSLLSLLELFILFNLEKMVKPNNLREAELMKQDWVAPAIVPFVKQQKRSPQSVLLSSWADPRSPSWRQEVLSVKSSVISCVETVWWQNCFLGLTDDLLFATAPLKKHQEGSIRKCNR